MPEESYSFAAARTRLEEIVGQVRKKETSLEKSLDLLEEGVRLANQCTELIDHADWEAAAAPAAADPVDDTDAQVVAAAPEVDEAGGTDEVVGGVADETESSDGEA